MSSALFERIPRANFDTTGRPRLLATLGSQLAQALPRSTVAEREQLLKELNSVIKQQKRREDDLDDQNSDSGSTTSSDSYDFGFAFQEFFTARKIPIRIDFKNVVEPRIGR